MKKLVLVHKDGCPMCDILKPVLDEYMPLKEDIIYEDVLVEDLENLISEEPLVIEEPLRIPQMIAYIDDKILKVQIGADPNATYEEHIEMIEEFLTIFDIETK